MAKAKQPAKPETFIGAQLRSHVTSIAELKRDIARHENQIGALEEAICPRVAARLTALERTIERRDAMEHAKLMNTAPPRSKRVTPEQINKLGTEFYRIFSRTASTESLYSLIETVERIRQ